MTASGTLRPVLIKDHTASNGELGGGVLFPDVFDAGVEADGCPVAGLLPISSEAALRLAAKVTTPARREWAENPMRRDGPGDGLGDQAGLAVSGVMSRLLIGCPWF